MSGADGDGGAGWLGRLRRGLGRSSAKLAGGIADLFTKRKLDAQALEALEDLLIAGDLGVATAARLGRSVAEARFDQDVAPEEVRAALAGEIAEPTPEPAQPAGPAAPVGTAHAARFPTRRPSTTFAMRAPTTAPAGA